MNLAGEQEKGGDSALMDDPSHKRMTPWPQDGSDLPAFLAAGLRGKLTC